MQLITVIAAAATHIIAIRNSPVALSWTVLAICLLRLGLLTQAVNRKIAGSWRDMGATVRDVSDHLKTYFSGFPPRVSRPGQCGSV